MTPRWLNELQRSNFPLPPGTTAGSPRVTDGAVVVSLDGATADEALQYYQDALPGMGYPKSKSVAIDPLSFAGNGVDITVVGDGGLHPTVTIRRS